MFARKLRVLRVSEGAEDEPVPLASLDSFCMRNFTNNAVFDDTLPIGDGLLEAGFRVPIAALEAAMEERCRRMGRLGAAGRIRVLEGERPHPTDREPGGDAGR